MAIPLLTVITLLVFSQASHAPAKKAKAIVLSSPWKTIVTKVGVSLSLPTDSGLISSNLPATKRVAQDTVTPKKWVGCKLQVAKKPFAKDEDPTDSDATKLEDFAFEEIDLESSILASLRYTTWSGFPAIELQGKDEDGNPFRFKICRSSSCYYECQLTGGMPEVAVLDHVFQSVTIPKDVTPGKSKSWGPVAQDNVLIKKHLSVWSPMPLTASDDLLDFTGDEVKQYGFGGEFGYSAYNVVVAEIPQELQDRYDEDTLDKLVVSKFSINDDGEHVKLGAFSNLLRGGATFRAMTYSDGDIQSRVEIAYSNGKLYLFWAVVPKGLLEGNDVKHFFDNIAIK